MEYSDKSQVSEAAKVTTAPSHCPTCQSSMVTTDSKVVDAATYWRCGGCCEIWNVARRRDSNRYMHAPSWRR